MRPIRSLVSIFVIFSIDSLAGRAHANEDIIELPLQPAKYLCGIVTYENGDPARGAKVEEVGQDWKGATHRSTESDSEGRFTLLQSRAIERRLGSLVKSRFFANNPQAFARLIRGQECSQT